MANGMVNNGAQLKSELDGSQTHQKNLQNSNAPWLDEWLEVVLQHKLLGTLWAQRLIAIVGGDLKLGNNDEVGTRAAAAAVVVGATIAQARTKATGYRQSRGNATRLSWGVDSSGQGHPQDRQAAVACRMLLCATYEAARLVIVKHPVAAAPVQQ
ncbi:hypothetical protein NL676_029598 [Syzygium grande]|nr:hypothetical protein NL676_029598 [Syzygium grande]